MLTFALSNKYNHLLKQSIMKKLFAVVLLAAAFAMPSKAQFSWGIQAGLNMTNVSVKDAEGSMKSRTGFFVGPTIKFTLPIIGLGIDASALYDKREGKAENGQGDTKTFESESLQIPINVRYGFGLGSIAEVFAFAGPQFGFKLGGDSDTSIGGTKVSEWSLRSSNLSANIGIGATIMSKLQAKINYNVALGKTGEFKAADANGVLEEIGSAKFNSWQVSLAYFF